MTLLLSRIGLPRAFITLKLLSVLVLLASLGMPAARYGLKIYWFGVRYPQDGGDFRAEATLRGKNSLGTASARCGTSAHIRQRLQAEPLSPDMLWCWSIVSADERADTALHLAAHVSRRNMQVQAALLQRAAEADDAADVLAHIDRILRVYPETGSEILPGLAGLIATSEGRALLSPYVDRPWFLPLVSQAVRRQVEPGAIALMLSSRRRAGGSLPKELISVLIAKMLEQDAFPEARKWAAALSGKPETLLDYFGASPLTVNQVYAPLTWRLPAGREVSGTYRPHGAIEFLVAPDSFLKLLERSTAYKPGIYSFRQETKMRTGSLMLEWILYCNRSAQYRPLWRQDLNPGDVREERIPARIDPGCTRQRWVLRANTGASAWPMSLAVGLNGLEAVPQ
ncbi:hypothetical protein YP76_18285 [Sphingobium chungbukense]|uniref:Uncharacterized protein n=2 Tax=Sphingobium chungbukense TaxID=56193 RepID=A0A0M3AL20_9SPHN|nr:hypothetical protein YP76_18285 [Sphingobium chungbukense]